MQTRSISSQLLRFKNSVPNILIGPRWLPSMGVCPRLRSGVVSNLDNAPPPPMAIATAAIDTLSGASQRLQASYDPNAYQKPCVLFG